MTFEEKRLYHQVYPAKLATDILTSIITLYLFWLHAIVPALVLHFALPLIGSLTVIHYVNLESIKASPIGHYLHRYMTPAFEKLRLVGDIITIMGAWYRLPWLIVVGLMVILAAWLNGMILLLR